MQTVSQNILCAMPSVSERTGTLVTGVKGAKAHFAFLEAHYESTTVTVRPPAWKPYRTTIWTWTLHRSTVVASGTQGHAPWVAADIGRWSMNHIRCFLSCLYLTGLWTKIDTFLADFNFFVPAIGEYTFCWKGLALFIWQFEEIIEMLKLWNNSFSTITAG